MTRFPSLSLKRDPKSTFAGAEDGFLPDPGHDHDFSPRADDSEAAQEASMMVVTSPPKPDGLLGWVSDRFLSASDTMHLAGNVTHIYSRIVSGVISNRAQMENYSPPYIGEFSLKRAAKWLMFKPNFQARGQFIIKADTIFGAGHAITVRSRMPLGPALPWVLLACLPAFGPLLAGRITGFVWEGVAAAIAWVIIAATPLILSYIKTCKALSTALNKALISAINAQTLDTDQARSSRVALVPARPALPVSTTEAEAEAQLIASMLAKKDAARRQEPAIKPEPKPEPVAATVRVEKAKPQPSRTIFKRKKIEFKSDAQALVRAQMQAQLEAQLAALDKAEIELKAAPAPQKSAEPVQALNQRIEAEVHTPAAKREILLPDPATNPSSRVGSRIKKFRTRYEATARPDAPEPTVIIEKPKSAPETADDSHPQKRKIGA